MCLEIVLIKDFRFSGLILNRVIKPRRENISSIKGYNCPLEYLKYCKLILSN